MPIPATLDNGRYSTYTVNVRDYGALGNGVTDDTAAITNAISACNSIGGGIVYFPTGVYISGNQTLYAYVNLQGSGIGATTIRLKAGSNTDLFSAQTSSINLAATVFTGITGTLLSFFIKDMTLDGNKANQTAGPSYPLRFYGYNFLLRDIEVLNGYTGGVLIDWSGPSLIATPSDEMEAYIDAIKIHDCTGIGLQFGGPHDSRFHNVVSENHTSHCFHFTPNALGCLMENIHGYYSPNTTGVCCMVVEASGCQFSNCVAEGAYSSNVAVLCSQFSWSGGSVYASSPSWTTSIGFTLGQNAGQTPLPGQIKQSAGVTTAVISQYNRIDTLIYECRGGAFNMVSEANNVIVAGIFQTVGTALVGNAINRQSDNFTFNIIGLTTDNTLGKSGGTNVVSNGSSVAFTVNDVVSGQVFQIDHSGNIYAVGGFNTAAGLYFTASTATTTLATGGTINLQGLPNIAVAPTSDVTGIILQAGYGGQLCIIINASAFTVWFAASGTSLVASGTQAKIAPMSACLFFYDGTNSLWHPCSYTSLPVQSSTAAVTATGGTVTITDLNAIRLAPTGAITGVILQVGQYAGQIITLMNESIYPITFAASGTSKNASGAADTIPGVTGRQYTWNTGTSLWYPLGEIPIQSPTVTALSSSGTINTIGWDTSRISLVASVTGVILASGNFGGQLVTVINESGSFTITFAASGTSHVADGVSDIIAAFTARLFKWDSTTALWYPCK